MAKRRVSKQSKRRLVILVPLSILAIFSCIFTIASMGYNLYTLQKEQKQLETNLRDMQKEADNLKTEITKLQDKDYVARYARENYLYTKDGEYVIKVDEDDKKNSDDRSMIKQEYVLYGSAILTVLIIIYIANKHKMSNRSKKNKKKTK